MLGSSTTHTVSTCWGHFTEDQQLMYTTPSFLLQQIGNYGLTVSANLLGQTVHHTLFIHTANKPYQRTTKHAHFTSSKCLRGVLLNVSTNRIISSTNFNPLNAELNPICHLLALLGGATIVVVSRLRVNAQFNNNMYVTLLSSTCFGPWHARPQEEQLHRHSIWYPRSPKRLYTTPVESRQSEDTRCCVCAVVPPEDGHVKARNMSRIVTWHTCCYWIVH